MFVRGLPTIITVDDFVPTQYGKPYFAGVGQDGSLWGPILEKAWAKVSGNYERINLGGADEAFRFFTGCPTDYTEFSWLSTDDVWTYLQSADNNNYMSELATNGGTDTQFNSYGLAMGHAYTMMGTYKV